MEIRRHAFTWVQRHLFTLNVKPLAWRWHSRRGCKRLLMILWVVLCHVVMWHPISPPHSVSLGRPSSLFPLQTALWWWVYNVKDYYITNLSWYVQIYCCLDVAVSFFGLILRLVELLVFFCFSKSFILRLGIFHIKCTMWYFQAVYNVY